MNRQSAAAARLTAQLSNKGGNPKTQSRQHVIKKLNEKKSFCHLGVNTTDGVQVSVEYKRTCTVWYTHCKHTGKEKDICYRTLNGVAQGPCGNWEQSN